MKGNQGIKGERGPAGEKGNTGPEGEKVIVLLTDF